MITLSRESLLSVLSARIKDRPLGEAFRAQLCALMDQLVKLTDRQYTAWAAAHTLEDVFLGEPPATTPQETPQP